jgi:hypothetical protein
MMKSAANQSSKEVRNFIYRPPSKDLKSFLGDLRGKHGELLDRFKEGYCRYLSEVDPQWAQMKVDGADFEALRKVVERGLMIELVDAEDGFPEGTFWNYCKFVRNAVKFGVPMKLAKKGIKPLLEMRDIAQKEFGNTSQASMLLAYDVWLEMKGMAKSQKDAMEAEATKRVLGKRGISVGPTPSGDETEPDDDAPDQASPKLGPGTDDDEDDDDDKEHVSFVAGKRGKRRRSELLESHFGLPSLAHVNGDYAELSNRVFDVLAAFFRQNGVVDWCLTDKSAEAKRLKALYKVSQV